MAKEEARERHEETTRKDGQGRAVCRKFHMSPLDKVPGVDNDPSKLPDDEDLPADWAEEDRQIEGRKPDLGEIEEDASEL